MIVKSINPSKLQDEFLKANIIVSSFLNNRKEGEYIAAEAKITFAENTDMALVQQIIDAHDPTPLPPQPTSEQQLTMEMTMAMAQMQMDNMMAIAELTNLIMAMGGV